MQVNQPPDPASRRALPRLLDVRAGCLLGRRVAGFCHRVAPCHGGSARGLGAEHHAPAAQLHRLLLDRGPPRARRAAALGNRLRPPPPRRAGNSRSALPSVGPSPWHSCCRRSLAATCTHFFRGTTLHAGQTLYGLLLTATVAISTQLIASGLVFRSLVRATSPGRAVLSVALVTGISQFFQPGHDATEACFLRHRLHALRPGGLAHACHLARRRPAVRLGNSHDAPFRDRVGLLAGCRRPRHKLCHGDALAQPAATTAWRLSFWAIAVVGLALIGRLAGERAITPGITRSIPLKALRTPWRLHTPAEHVRMEADAAKQSAALVPNSASFVAR